MKWRTGITWGMALWVVSVQLQADPFKLPSYESYQLANGLQVYLMQRREVPLLHVSAAVQTGSAADGEHFGLASLTGDALILGTQNMSKDRLENAFDFHGALISSVTYQDYSQLKISMASQDAARLLPIFADLMMAPTFPEREVKRLRERVVAELNRAKQSPNQVADQYFNRLIFDRHPYGHPIMGTPDSLSPLKNADLRKFHKAWYRPQWAALSIVGDFDLPEMKKRVEQSFGSWISGTGRALTTPAVAVSKPASSRVLLVNKENAQETTFRIGGLAVQRDDKDWMGLQVVNTILGGRFTSLLNEELRVKTGLTYGARSLFEGFKNSGTFAIASFTSTENTRKTLDLTLKTYQVFVKNGVDEKTLESARSFMKGIFPTRYETSDALGGLLIQMWVYHLPDTIISTFESEVSSLTVTRANDLIRRHFQAGALDILLIGQAAKIQDIAQQYGRLIKADINTLQEGRL